MTPFFRLSFDCDWSSLSPNFWPYGLPNDMTPGVFNVTFLSDMSLNSSVWPAPQDHKRTPLSFEDVSVQKYGKWSMHAIPLTPVRVNMMVNILHGTRLLNASAFVDTCTVSVKRPIRADYGTNNMFLTIVDTRENVALDMPLNLPHLELTQNTYLVSYGAVNGSSPLVNEKFDSLYLSQNDRVTYGADGVYALPFLPYFSNCRGFGSYIMLFDIWENEEYCKLVPPEQTKVVSQTDFFQSAISDECLGRVKCQYVGG